MENRVSSGDDENDDIDAHTDEDYQENSNDGDHGIPTNNWTDSFEWYCISLSLQMTAMDLRRRSEQNDSVPAVIPDRDCDGEEEASNCDDTDESKVDTSEYSE